MMNKCFGLSPLRKLDIQEMSTEVFSKKYEKVDVCREMEMSRAKAAGKQKLSQGNSCEICVNFCFFEVRPLEKFTKLCR
jgi:hypothetical protein